MSTLLARLAELFVEPRRGGATRSQARDRRACARASVVVVGDRGAARAGAALAAALARGGRAPFALLCVWGADRASAVVPPLPATAAAATKLRARGHDARGFGRVLSVALSGADDEALGETARAVAAVAGRHDVPLVLALCAPRSAEADARLGEYDLVIVVRPAGSDTLLATVAAGRLTEHHPGLAVVCAELPASTHRFAPPPRAAVRSALEALR